MAHPPAQPAYILRGHDSQIHATAFIRGNTRLITGDSEGWVVVWCLETKRPRAVWRAHEGSILGVWGWGGGRLITHGKDNKLIVWKFSLEDESSLSTILPVEISTSTAPHPQPWVLHILQVNTMNFCSFAPCIIPSSPSQEGTETEDELLIAVPNILTSETVDIFHLPSTNRIHTLPSPGPPSFKGGMIMALSLFHHPITNHLTVISGYESGYTTVAHLHPATQTWNTLYLSNPHTQPILSLDISPSKEYYLTSSADAVIAKHPTPLPPPPSSSSSSNRNNQQLIITTPLKILQTKHSGQQSLRIRSDGKIFATAGWDSRIRVYSCKSLKELAVLKWHKEGCYAVCFAEILEGNDAGKENGEEEAEEGPGESGKGKEVVRAQRSVKEERIWKARNAHWLIGGSKDGKVSLWDIY